MCQADKKALALALDDRPGCLVTRLALADWYDEQGDSERAGFHRWLARMRMWPDGLGLSPYSKHDRWYWCSNNPKNEICDEPCAPYHHASLGDLCYETFDRQHWEWKTREEAEEALFALFLNDGYLREYLEDIQSPRLAYLASQGADRVETSSGLDA